MLLKMSSNFIKIFLNINFNHKFKYLETDITQLCAVKRMRKIKPECKKSF